MPPRWSESRAAGGIRRVATYSVPRPGGALGAKDNGTWQVAVNAGEVTDTNDDTVIAAAKLGRSTSQSPMKSPPV